MPDQLHNVDIAHRSGAYQISPGAQNCTVDSDQLPLIVWLRGDESYFSDFNVSADDAMEQLKIRRSRLTQISGRELRVGRTRIDRYIRPVYRSVDILAYLGWTRQTASHQKSTEALKAAALILSTKSEELTEGLLQKSAGISQDLIEQLIFGQKQSQELLLEKFDALGQRLTTIKSELNAAIDDRYFRLSNKMKSFQELTSAQSEFDIKISALSNSMLYFITEVQKLSAEANHRGSQQQKSIAEQSLKIERLEELIEAMVECEHNSAQRKTQKFKARPKFPNISGHSTLAAMRPHTVSTKREKPRRQSPRRQIKTRLLDT